MISKIFKVIALIGLVALLAYAGACIYGNFIAKPEPVPGQIEMPKADKAAYFLVVKNTATVILTNDYEQFGDKVGERTFVLHGYWELVGSAFSYRAHDIILQEAIFGEIALKKR